MLYNGMIGFTLALSNPVDINKKTYYFQKLFVDLETFYSYTSPLKTNYNL